jgi:hypothetical protein
MQGFTKSSTSLVTDRILTLVGTRDCYDRVSISRIDAKLSPKIIVQYPNRIRLVA